jgi:E1A/CREB-binding protein
MQRIRRNASYHTDATKQNCWCAACYSKLKEYEVITLDDGAETKKSRLQSAKHDSIPEEAWVECDDCKTRVHQICALYNGRRTKERSTVWCPKCTLVNREDDAKPSEFTNRAQNLPKCKMSDSMEAGLEKSLATAYEAKARELGVGVDEVEKAKGLSIRVLSHIEKHHAVRDLVSGVF